MGVAVVAVGVVRGSVCDRLVGVFVLVTHARCDDLAVGMLVLVVFVMGGVCCQLCTGLPVWPGSCVPGRRSARFAPI